MSREYTLDELDAMRDAIRSTHIPSNAMRSINEEVEEKLKTYILAGVKPQDLIDREHIKYVKKTAPWAIKP